MDRAMNPTRPYPNSIRLRGPHSLERHRAMLLSVVAVHFLVQAVLIWVRVCGGVGRPSTGRLIPTQPLLSLCVARPSIEVSVSMDLRGRPVPPSVVVGSR